MMIAHRASAVRWRKVLLAVIIVVGYSVFGVALAEPMNHHVSEWRSNRLARAQPAIVCKVHLRAVGCSLIDRLLDDVAKIKL